MSSLAEEYPKEMQRVRSALSEAKGMIATGFPQMAFYAHQAEDLLDRASAALASQDIVAQISIFQELKDFKE